MPSESKQTKKKLSELTNRKIPDIFYSFFSSKTQRSAYLTVPCFAV